MDDDLWPGDTRTARLRDPGEIAAALPHLLGFRPVASLVLLALGGPSGGRVLLTARADLPPPGVEGLGEGLAEALVRGTDGVGDLAAVVAVVVSEDADVPGTAGPDLPHRDVLGSLVGALHERDLPLREALLVRDGRWWSYECPRPCCRPGAGTPLPRGTGELAALSVAAGQVVARDRDELAARLAPLDGPGTAAMAGELVRAGRSCAAEVLARGPAAVAEDTWTAVTDALGRLRDRRAARLPEAEVARIVWGLVSPVVRDRALLLGLGPDARTAEDLWTECARRVPPPLDAVPLTLAAVAAWLRGDGATARIALARARDSDPTYELALLLERALDDCLPPRRLRELIAGVGSGRW